MADRKLNIQVAFNALNNMSRPVSAARQSAAALASQIKQTQSNIKGLERQASSFDRLTAANKKTTDQLAQAKTQAREMAATFGPLRQRSTEQVTALNQQRAAIRNLTQQQKTEQTQLNQLRASFYNEGVAIRSTSRATEQISQRTAQYNRQLADQKRRLDTVSQAQARYSRAKETGSKMMGGGMKTAAGGAGILYGSQRIMSPGFEFDEGMSKVQALTRLDKNSAEMGSLRSEARRLGATTAFTSGDAASGQAFLAMAGFTPQAIRQALPGVLNMALAGSMELGESADIGSNILSQFKLSADQMDRVSDVLTGTFTRTNTDLRQLSETMVYAGPVAASLGIDLETMSAMAGALADKGLRGSMAGTALRSSLARLASPTTKAQQALDELGVSVADASGKMLPVESILTNLYQKSQKFGQVDQVSFWKDIAGEEAFVGLQTLVEAAGKGSLQKLTGELQKAQGEATKNANTMKDNLRGDLKEMQSAWEDLGIQMEESVDSPLRYLTQKFTVLISAVGGWMKDHPQLTSMITKSVLAIGAMAAVLGTLALAIGSILGPLALIRLSFSMLTGGGGISSLIGGVTRLGGVFQWLAGSPMQALLSAGRMVFGPLITLLAGISAPVWGLIALFAVAAVAVIKFWQPIKAFFSGFFTGLITGLQPITQAFNAVFTPLKPIFDRIGNALSGIWDWFTKLLKPIQFSSEALASCTSAGETFGKVVGAAISALTLPIQVVAKGLGWILEKLGAIPDAAKAAQQVAQQMTPEAVNNLADRVNAFSGDVKAVVKESKKAEENKKKLDQKNLEGSTNLLRRQSSSDTALSKMNGNLDKIASNTAEKKDGPGEIVFKNKQPYIPIRGGYAEPVRQAQRQVPSLTAWMQQAGALISSVIPYSVQQPAARSPVSAVPSAASVAAAIPGGDVFNFEININDAGRMDEQKLVQRIREEFTVAQQQAARRKRSQLTDHE